MQWRLNRKWYNIITVGCLQLFFYVFTVFLFSVKVPELRARVLYDL